MKGGIILTREWQNRDEEALLYFISNCSNCRILTDYSLSCVTYVLTFNPANPALTPYRRMRSSNLAENVTCILLKIGLRSRNRVASYVNLSRWDPANPQRDPYNNEIQQVPEEDFRREVETQHRVFTDSFLHHTSPCEPICPGIITSSWTPSQRVIDRIRAVLLGPTLQQRTNVSRRKPRDVDITRNLLEIQPGINIIAMEFMEGFQTLYSLSNDPRYGKFKIMHFFELLRLRIYFNTIHTDAHEENVMIDPRYNYFTNSEASPWKGRAIIIDFGRVQSEQAQMTRAQILEIYRIYQNHMALLPAIDRGRIQEYIQELFTRRETMVATFLATLYPGQLDELNYRVQAHTVQMNPAAAPAPARQLVDPAAPAALPRQLGPRPLVAAAAPAAPAAPAAGFFDSILQYASISRIFSFGNRLLNIFVPAAPAPVVVAPAPAAPVVVAPAPAPVGAPAPAPPAPAPPAPAPPAPAVVAPAPAVVAPASNFGECAICLLEFDGNDPITQVHTTTQCHGDQCHFFHTRCINGVQRNQAGIIPCPICRLSCTPTRGLPVGTQIDRNNNIIPPGAAPPAPVVAPPAPAAPVVVDVAAVNAVNAQIAEDEALARQLRNDDLARFARQGGPAVPAQRRAPAVPAPAGLGVGYAPRVARQGGPAPRLARQGGPAPAGLGIADAVRAARERDERAEDERLARERAERVARERADAERAPAVDEQVPTPMDLVVEDAPAVDEQVPEPMDLDVEDAPAVENLETIILQSINQTYTAEISLINGYLAEWNVSLTNLANFYQEMLNHLTTRDISQTQTLGLWQRDRPNVLQAENRILDTRASINAIVTTIQAFTVRYNGNEVNIPRDTIIARFLNHYNPQLQFYDGRIASVCNLKNTMRHNLINLFGISLIDPLPVGGAILIKRKNDIKKNQTSNNLYVIYDFFGIPFKAYATKLYNTKSLEFLAKIEGSDNFNSLNDDNIPLTEIQYDILNLSTNKFMEKYNINTMKIENNDIDINEIKKNLNNELNDVSYLSTDNKESSGGKKNITKRYTKRLTKRFTKHLNKRFTKRLNKRLKKRSTKRLNKQYTKRFTKRSTKLYKKS